MNKVFITGDIHGEHDIRKLTSYAFPEQKDLTKDDKLIALGDFAFPWSAQKNEGVETIKSHEDFTMSPSDEYWLNWLYEKNYTLYVLLGNHEGAYSILKYIEEEYDESIQGPVKKVPFAEGKSINYLSKSSDYIIEGKRILVVGGADSIDKEYRTPGVSWWEEETLSAEEIKQVVDIVEKDNKFDYVLTHTCPDKFLHRYLRGVSKYNDPVALFLDNIYEMIEFSEWHHGHLHQDLGFTTGKGLIHGHYNNSPFELIGD